ncbi:MAG: class I SAM-dependent methyltransferase family protein [Crenarchaeota archaeon]|nr:class I SAM-dependent methyltransferase family protein [Thermoproteota archaeon]
MVRVKDLLKDKIPKELIELVPTSFDIVGSRQGAVAIVEIPEELEEYKYEIAKAIMKINKHVKAVLRRKGPRRGAFRLYEYEILIPGPTEVVHKEAGYLIKLDPTKVYFSPRDQSDRLEIAEQVRDGETILYLFAGVAPYAVAICKRKNVHVIHCVEINPVAVRYMIENIRLNKLKGKIVPIEGDVNIVAPKFYYKSDRVLMTLPLGAHEYVHHGILCIRREGGVLHFYHVGKEPDIFSEAEKIIRETAERFGREVSIINRKIVRDYAPRMYKIRLDVYVR